jgi:hypothetical protein
MVWRSNEATWRAPSRPGGRGHHHADEGERIHLHGADEDQRLGDRRQHALAVEGTGQHPIIDQLELLVAGGLHRKAAHPQGIEKIGDKTDGRHRPERGGLSWP